jgi:uncharacterized membrane protein
VIELAVPETTGARPATLRECSVRETAPVPKSRTLVLVLTVVFFNAFGNLALAWGMRHVPETNVLRPLGFLTAMLNPFVAGGITLLILWLLTRMALLSWADLSFVLPLTSLGYVCAAFFGEAFLHESVSAVRWLGTLLIFAGTAMVGATEQRTDKPGGDE